MEQNTTALATQQASAAMISFDDVQRMGMAIAKSGMFGMKTPEQAIALMLIAQAEGRHPATAAMDYHIIQGKASLKADTMLARFLKDGGKVEWHEYSDTRCCATFTHPAGGTVKVDWDMERAKRAGVAGNTTYKAYCRAMFRARVISEGVRTVDPGVLSGMYTPEEAQHFGDDATPKRCPRQADVEVVPEQQDAIVCSTMPEDGDQMDPREEAAQVDLFLTKLEASQSLSELESVAADIKACHVSVGSRKMLGAAYRKRKDELTPHDAA